MTNSVAPPSKEDYDRAKRVAVLETLQSAPVLLVTGGGILGGAACGVWALTSPLVAGAVAVGGLLTGGALWFTNLARNSDKIQATYREALHKRANEFRLERLTQLERSLGDFECPQGSSQVKEFGEKFDTLVEILGKKLSSSELTYSRFVTNAELICGLGIKNLEKAVDLLTSIRTIEIAEVKRRIGQLKRISEPTTAEKRTLVTLQMSAKIYEDAQTEIADVLAQNEESLTVLEQAAVAASQIQNGSVSEMEIAMKELLHIASRQIVPEKQESLL
jgi:hypothetical protein